MDISQFRSGRFEPRYEYQAFLPEKVCHEWVVSDPALTELLGRADRALGGLNAFAQLVPDVEFFIRMHVAKEATQSSRIEGTQTNIEDAFKEADDLNPEERDDWAEVQNYIRAIHFAIRSLERLPLSNRLLRETHAELLRGVRGEHKSPGEFRQSQNWIGVSLKNAAFVPPHHEHVPDLMSDLEKLLNDTTIYAHPLLRIAIAHYQFETIHPFLDGNGRLGRLMISLYLCSEGLLERPALYLSDYFERHKTAYVDHLMAVREGHHLKEWLIFFLHGVEETARESAAVFRKILALKERMDTKVLPHFHPRRLANVQTLMRHLYGRPVADSKWAAQKMETTTTTATTILLDLVNQKVLTEITGQRRNRLFAFQEYISLFEQ